MKRSGRTGLAHATPGKTPDSSGVEASSFEFLRAEEGEISYSVVSGSYQFAGRKVRA